MPTSLWSDSGAAWLALREAVATLTLWAFLWGTAVLAFRATSSTAATFLLWGTIGIPITLLIAWRMALRRMPAPATIRAMLGASAKRQVLIPAWPE